MTFDPNAVQKTLDAFKAAYKSPIDDPRLAGVLAKSTFAQNASATSGLTYYDLESGAKFLYPVLTPLRNRIPRVSGKGGIQANWRAVTGVNTSNVRLGVSGGNRGGVMAISTQDYVAVYKGIGLEDNVDFEAQYAGMGFDDIRAVAAKTLLEAVMIGEEQLILGGNNSLALGTTPTPTLAASSSGGSLATQTLSVICVALSLDAVINGSVASGIQGQITRASAGPYSNSDVFGGGAAKVPATQLNTMVDAVEAALTPTGPDLVTQAVQTLGGLVAHCWIEGGIEYYEGLDANGRSVAIIPIAMLLP